MKEQYKIEEDAHFTAMPDYESRNALERYYQQRKVKFVCKAAKEMINEKCETFVDLGSGDGLFLDFAKTFNQKMTRIGVELGRSKCKKMQERKHAAVCGDVEFVPLKSNSVDIAFLLDVIEHLYEPKALSEIHRILRDGGDLLLSTPNKFGVYEHKQLVSPENFVVYPKDIWNGLKGKPRSYAPYHVKLYSYKDLSKALKEHGFTILYYRVIGFCFPFLGTVYSGFSAFKKGDVFVKKAEKILEFFEKRLPTFSFFIIVHARKNPSEGSVSK